MKLVGADPKAEAQGAKLLPGKSNYFIGNDPTKWKTGIQNFAQAGFKNIYPGIDLRYYGNQGQLEYDFVLKPGADIKAIEWKISGVKKIGLDPAGNLRLTVSEGTIEFNKPLCYLEADGLRTPIPGRYVMRGGDRVGFSVAGYHGRGDLVIDPTLSYSTYLGGSGGDQGRGIAADSSGNAYITGITSSVFPTLAGSYQTTPGGGGDVFISKLNPNGTALLYSTYLGGAATEAGYGITVDTGRNAYVTGQAAVGLPVTVGSFQPACAGGIDAFICKLSPSGSALLYSSYYGGTGDDVGRGIAVDVSGNAYVTGSTVSTDLSVTTGAIQTAFGGGSFDSFVFKVNSSGSVLLYSTYWGGSNTDDGNGIAVDLSGNAYVLGSTSSTDLAGTAGAFQTAYGGGTSDAFVLKIDPAVVTPVYFSYLGGIGEDYGSAIALGSGGTAYLTGQTQAGGFPVTVGAFQTVPAAWDAFVSKLNPSGSALIYSTYLGGASNDIGTGIAVDVTGNAHVTGGTDGNFVTTAGARQTIFGGSVDAFYSELNLTGTAQIYSTYLGGAGFDIGLCIAVDGAKNAYLTGMTAGGFPTTSGVFQTTFGGSDDAFVAKFSEPPSSSGGSDPLAGGACFRMLGNNPSPAKATGTYITYHLCATSTVTIKIYTVSG
ncbi:MAG: SBBP repeat-containing protein, partial [candidate division FCPU426 bacterium]